MPSVPGADVTSSRRESAGYLPRSGLIRQLAVAAIDITEELDRRGGEAERVEAEGWCGGEKHVVDGRSGGRRRDGMSVNRTAAAPDRVRSGRRVDVRRGCRRNVGARSRSQWRQTRAGDAAGADADDATLRTPGAPTISWAMRASVRDMRRASITSGMGGPPVGAARGRTRRPHARRWTSDARDRTTGDPRRGAGHGETRLGRESGQEQARAPLVGLAGPHLKSSAECSRCRHGQSGGSPAPRPLRR